MTTTTTTTAPPAPKNELGDVNEDEVVDGRDATAILTDYAYSSTSGKSGFTKAQQLVADVNHDGIIDGRDATAVLTYYAYISTGKKISVDEFMKNINK